MRKRILRNNQTRNQLGIQVISHCRDLIWIDSAPIKNSEQKKCKEVYKKIETAKKKIEEHETFNQPEYSKWFHSLFGKELTEIRELAESVSKKTRTG